LVVSQRGYRPKSIQPEPHSEGGRCCVDKVIRGERDEDAPAQNLGSAGHNASLFEGAALDVAERWAADEVLLGIEQVVDGAVGGEKALG
jgi:hypothetical protein